MSVVPDLARQLVDAVLSDFPDHRPGTRPVHTFGIGVKGHFIASAAAARFCTAEHFQGAKIPATIRYSNGSGSGTRRDGVSDVRGMATRFHLPSGAATDLIAMTLGEFFTSTPEQFLDFTKESRPTPVRREKWWRKLLDMLQLELPLPDPLPGQTSSGGAGLMSYANRHNFARLAVFDAAGIGTPTSYARATYHAVHTFVVTDPEGGRRSVRFTWQPVAGVRRVDPSAPTRDLDLQQEMRERLERRSARFMLKMTIGEVGDALADPTRPWPQHRRKVVMGTLYLTSVAEDQEGDCERMSYNPCLLVPGIEVSDDPILRVRKDAYLLSGKERGAARCPFHGEGD